MPKKKRKQNKPEECPAAVATETEEDICYEINDDILDDKIDSSRIIDIEEDTYIGICKILHLEKVDLLLVSRINESAKDLLEFLKINVLSLPSTVSAEHTYLAVSHHMETQ